MQVSMKVHTVSEILSLADQARLEARARRRGVTTDALVLETIRNYLKKRLSNPLYLGASPEGLQ